MAQLPIVDRLKKELAEMQHELSHDLPLKLEEARAHGDLRENAEYEAAKNRQGVLRARIGQLQERIRELSMYTVAQIPRDRISYGSRVSVEDVDCGDTMEFRFMFPEELEAGSSGTGMISINSPMGKAFMNHAEGDEVVVQTPRGRKTYQVLSVVTLHDQPPGKTAA